ncbi:MAG: hypothetical protein ACLQNE_44880 [Thermoguttaceae bacterium]|jgi:hypothetical protein
MLFLAQSLLRAAGFRYDETEETWIARTPLCPMVTVECDERREYILEAISEVRAILSTKGCTFNNFSVYGRCVSISGLTTVDNVVAAA